MTPKAQATKEKTEILNCIKTKNFYVSNDTIRVNRQPMEWEKILANHISDKDPEYNTSTTKRQAETSLVAQ